MNETEIRFQELLLANNSRLDKPEVAAQYAYWLIALSRYQHASLIVKTALLEGSRFDLYELRALTNLTDLENLWKKIHQLIGIRPEKSGGELYNQGQREEFKGWDQAILRIQSEQSSA